MTLRLLLFVGLSIALTQIYGQSKSVEKDFPSISTVTSPICPAGDEHSTHFVPPSNKKSPYKELQNPFEAQFNAAFPVAAQRAVRDVVIPLLNNSFSSPIPVIVRLNWGGATDNTLAAASPESFVVSTDPIYNRFSTFYPVSLAEKITRQELNIPGQPDIIVGVNSEIDWCFDCETPEEVGDRLDFPSTILHEIYHGIGFFAFSNVDGDVAAQFFRDEDTNLVGTSVFNVFMENTAMDSTALIPNGTQELLSHFQGNDLFFDLETGGRARLFAPTIFQPGSSISHLDENTFNNTESSLMTPNSARGEVERGAGLAEEIMLDIGWAYTYLEHDPVDPTIETRLEDFTVRIEVTSDVGIPGDTIFFNYSSDGFTLDNNRVLFSLVEGNIWEAVIPAPTETTRFNYFIEATDNRGMRFSNPGILFTGVQIVHVYNSGPDLVAPELTHELLPSIFVSDRAIPLFANTSDDYTGLNEIIIQWRLNGVDQPPIDMVLDTEDLFEDDRYIGDIPLPAINLEDVIEYQIVPSDNANSTNSVSIPASGFHRVAIEDVRQGVEIYTNDFNIASEDFEGPGFSIIEPIGFSDEAIHSDHPYDGAGQNRTLNLVYELLQPIIIREPENANMEYDEIVLVEPGVPGVRFGNTNFFDFVVVEGRRLGTDMWIPFFDGYDSSDDPDWERAYNNGVPANSQDSNTRGTPSLFKTRSVDLQESGDFATGDTILIRFRLFSDPFAVGWGWAIDNLIIQDESVDVEDFIIEGDFTVAPNPAFDKVSVNLQLTGPAESIQLTITDVSGRRLITDNLPTSLGRIQETYDVSELSAGVYFINVIFDRTDALTKKLVINR